MTSQPLSPSECLSPEQGEAASWRGDVVPQREATGSHGWVPRAALERLMEKVGLAGGGGLLGERELAGVGGRSWDRCPCGLGESLNSLEHS